MCRQRPACGKFDFYNTSTGVVQWKPPGIAAGAIAQLNAAVAKKAAGRKASKTTASRTNNTRASNHYTSAPKVICTTKVYPKSPVLHAIIKGRTETVKLLHELGADVKFPPVTKGLSHTVVAAAKEGHVDTLKMLHQQMEKEFTVKQRWWESLR